jgi:hypothetical protein
LNSVPPLQKRDCSPGDRPARRPIGWMIQSVGSRDIPRQSAGHRS